MSTPEQHLDARRIRTFYSVMQNSWIGSDTSEPMYAYRAFQDWMADMEATDKGELVKLVKKECRGFSSIIVRVLRNRLRSTWQHIQALELIDPLGSVWYTCGLECPARSLWSSRYRLSLVQRTDHSAQSGGVGTR